MPRDLDAEYDEPEATEGFASLLPLTVFLRNAVEGLLIARGWRHHQNPDGDFEFDLKSAGTKLTFTLGHDDSEGAYTVQAASGLDIAPDDAGRALELCNRWNIEQWWPKVYVESAGEETEFRRFRSEDVLRTGATLSQALVDEFTGAALDSARRFWDWLYEQDPGLEMQ